MELNAINKQHYTIESSRYIQRLDATMSVVHHDPTNAKLIVVETKDDQKVFSVTFKTLPKDGSGVAHILEHSVFCGSTKYPIKDPFIELAKGSLNTFTNAMTYPDKTIYPVASCNLQDFKNAMAIYCDAVFHPLVLTNEKTFLQEGWHYEFDEDDQLMINGVVYNEMKGVFSNIDDCINEYIMQSLFPDTTYGVCSGGDPQCIPTLSYDDFKAFHGRYYHPSNARFFLYGDCDMNERLMWLDQAVLAGYTRTDVESTIPYQPGFDHPHTITIPYSVENDIDHEVYYAYNIGFDHSLDQKELLAYRLIMHALFNSNGAPLRQALNQKGIGLDMMAGLMDGIQQPYLSIIVKHATHDDQDSLIQTIDDVVNDALVHGCDRDKLLAGLNTIKFNYTEGSSGIPYGLAMNLTILDSWLYDLDPYAPIELEGVFEDIQQDIESDGLTSYIKKAFKDHPYRSLVIMDPTKNLASQQAQALAKRLQEYKASLSVDQIHALKAKQEQLKAYQESENDPHDVAKLPMLSKDDLDDHIRINNMVKTMVDDHPLYLCTHNQCGDIVYLSMLIDLDDIGQTNIEMAALISRLWTRISTRQHDYDQLENQIMLHTGGINGGMDLFSCDHDRTFKMTWTIDCKCFLDQLNDAMDLVCEIVTTSIFEHKRVTQVVDEIVSDLASALQANGHSVALNHAFAGLSLPYQLKEKMNGIDFYRYMQKVATLLHGEDHEGIDAWLNQLKDMVRSWISNDRISYLAVVSPRYQEEFPSLLSTALNHSTWFEPQIHPRVNYVVKPSVNEAYTTSGNVNYVAQASPLSATDTNYGTWMVFANLMNYDYLWTKIRVLGGAYGQFAVVTRSGLLGLTSYRDPNCVNTYHVYEGICDYLSTLELDDTDLLKLIIGTIGGIDAPVSPSRYGAQCFINMLYGLSDTMRQKQKRMVLGCTNAQLQALANQIKDGLDHVIHCTIGTKASIDQATSYFDVVKPLL